MKPRLPSASDPRAVGASSFRKDSSGKACLPTQTLGIPQMSQVEPVRREGELWRIRAQAGLSVVAVMAVDIFFHFFYILTIPSDLKFANRLPDSALGGCASGQNRGWERQKDPLRPHGVTAGEADTLRGHSTYPRVGGRGLIL